MFSFANGSSQKISKKEFDNILNILKTDVTRRMKEKDAIIENLTRQMKEKDAIIENLTRQLKEKDAINENLTHQLKETPKQVISNNKLSGRSKKDIISIPM
jgi:hypothetical protein